MEHLSFWWTFLAALLWSCHNVSVMEVQRGPGRTGLRESHQYSEGFNIWSQIKLGKRGRASEACRWLANGPMGHGLGPGMGNFNKRHFRPQNSLACGDTPAIKAHIVLVTGTMYLCTLQNLPTPAESMDGVL
jgi:hypothetical protein